MSEELGFESLLPTDIMISALAAGLAMIAVWYFTKRVIEHDYDSIKSLFAMDILSYLAYLYFSRSFYTSSFQGLLPIDTFHFVMYATMFLVLFPIAVFIYTLIQ